MSIILKDINEENWIQCIKLTTDENNEHILFEKFVASNAVSIAQSKIQDGWTIKGIYDEEVMVGFTMYGYCGEDSFYEICRLMIDYKFQGRGYGREAMGLIIEELKKIEDCKEIYISFVPENTRAKKLYESFGFKDVNKIIDGESLYLLKLDKN